MDLGFEKKSREHLDVPATNSSEGTLRKWCAALTTVRNRRRSRMVPDLEKRQEDEPKQRSTQEKTDIPGQPGEDRAKAAWLHRNNQFSDATTMAVTVALASVLVANRFLQENLFEVQLCSLLLSPLFSAIGVGFFKRYISGKEDLLRRDQITLMSQRCSSARQSWLLM